MRIRLKRCSGELPQIPSEAPPSTTDSRDDLAYDAALRVLEAQNETLTNTRNRAGGLLTVATLITSLSAAAGWLNGGRVHGLRLGLGIALLATLVLIGVIAGVVLRPRYWYHTTQASEFLERPANETPTQMRNAILQESLIVETGKQRKILNRLGYFYWFGLYLLVIEVGLVVGISFTPTP